MVRGQGATSFLACGYPVVPAPFVDKDLARFSICRWGPSLLFKIFSGRMSNSPGRYRSCSSSTRMLQPHLQFLLLWLNFLSLCSSFGTFSIPHSLCLPLWGWHIWEQPTWCSIEERIGRLGSGSLLLPSVGSCLPLMWESAATVSQPACHMESWLLSAQASAARWLQPGGRWVAGRDM